MINVLKCEMMKCFKGLALYICMFVMIFIPLSEYLFMTISSKMQSDDESIRVLIDSFVNANGDQIFKYLYGVLFTGGSIFVVVTVLAAIIIAEDYSRGTVKYIVLLTDRNKTSIGKVCTLVIVSTIIHFVGCIVPIGISILSRETYYGVYTMKQLILYVLLGWTIVMTYTILVGIIGGMTKNVPATIGLGLGIYLCCMGIGIHLPESVRKFIFIMNIEKIGEQDIGRIVFSLSVCYITFFIMITILSVVLKKKEY